MHAGNPIVPYTRFSKRGANRAPVRSTMHEKTRKISVAPSPMLRFDRSLMAPMICGEKVSPKR